MWGLPAASLNPEGDQDRRRLRDKKLGKWRQKMHETLNHYRLGDMKTKRQRRGEGRDGEAPGR